ncbi:MAG TPA: hypothetical protein VI837_03075, partial [Blastocatellia bacterium]|nr:hypothetical protein [Blastocatellia bacterium]
RSFVARDWRSALITITKSGSYRVRVSPHGDTEATVVSGELQFINAKGETGIVTKRKRVRFFKPKERVGEDR